MKWIHPNSSWAAVVAAVWCACACGCRNQPSGLPNPFLAPDRVPPPATRTLLPGQAQPYYPGDPLPVMQSSLTPGAAPGTTNNSSATAQFTSNDGLNWSGSGAGSGDPRTTWSSEDAFASNGPARSVPKSNESAVAIPSDGDSLRFALPAPETALAESNDAVTPTANSPQETVRLAAAPQPLSSASLRQYAVVPASYAATTINMLPAPSISESARVNPAPNGPWRSPQIEQTNSVMPADVRLATSAGAGTFSPHNRMDVRLRAVPSPAPEPVEPTTPRIRLPSQLLPQATYGAATLMQPPPFYATLNPAVSALQTVPLGSLPAPPNSVATGFATPQAVVASSDGFRPRTSRR